MISPYFQLNIPKRNERCSKGQEALQPGMAYYSVLFENGNELMRQDFCQACWQASNHPSHKHWKSVVVDQKKPKQPPTNRIDKAWELLKQTNLVNTPESKNEAFILALFLARAKRLLLRQQHIQEDRSIVYLYECAETEEMIGVTKMKLSQLDIIHLQKQINEKLA